MLRSLFSKPFLAIAVAVVTSAVMISVSIAKETPVGTVKGTIIGSDTGRQIPKAQVTLAHQGSAGADEWLHRRTDENGKFSFADIPAGGYTIAVQAKAHSLSPMAVTVIEGHVEDMQLETHPAPPNLDLYVHQQMFTSKEKPEIVLDGFNEADSAEITIFKIDVDKVISGEAGIVREILSQGGGDIDAGVLAKNPALLSVQTLNYRLTNRDIEGVFHQKIKFDPMKPGLYVVIPKVGNMRKAGWFSVSDISLVTKESGPDVLAYVVTPDTGTPVPGAEVTVVQGKAVLSEGITDATGLWRTRLATKATKQNYTRLFVARLGDSTAFLNSYSYYNEPESVSIYAYTDRPIYRPGQTVHFKGILRKFVNDAYRVPSTAEVRVDVKDKRNTTVYSQTLKTNRFGSFSGDFRLPQYAATGSYDVICWYSGRSGAASFSVAEYRKPEFTVDVEMPKRCIRGETVKAKIRASYYFGAPVVGATVSYYVSRSDYWFYPDEREYSDYGGYEYEYEDYGDYGEGTVEGKAITGPDGTAEISFNAYWPIHKDEYAPMDQQFTVYAYVTDQSRRESDGNGSIVSTQGDLKLSVNPDKYLVTAGDRAGVTILAADYDRRPQQGVEMEVTASRVKWDYDDAEGSREQYIEAAKATVRTDARGRAAFNFTPRQEGSYAIRVQCRDRRGHVIKSQGWIWVPGKGEFSGYDYPDLQIVLDKKEYDPGDTAKVLINSGEKGSTALLSVEGRRLFNIKQIKLDSKTTVVEVPIKPEYKPNFYISVCYVKNKRFISQEARARVSLRAQSLNISVTPDKKTYEPGDKATYRIKATYADGRPARAEVSLGVVDEAIYAIQEDDTRPIRDFFYSGQSNNVQTRFSFPEIYLSGDKGGYSGKVRKEFADTAFWRPDVVTDKNGEASVTFKMPDNLTTWRATARAATLDTAAGETTSTAICSKKLLVRLETPRFLVQGDSTVISVLTHNYLPDAQDVIVGLQAKGLKVEGRPTVKITVDSKGMERVEWKVSALRPGTATIMAYATGSKAEDAMQLTIPIRPAGQRQVETKTGSMSSGSQTVRILARGDSTPGASTIRVRMAPSLASAMLGSLDYLAQYPYGCTEQTTSAFIPDVVIWRTLKTLGIQQPDLQRRLPDMVGTGLNKLYEFQHDEGGWGWCEYGKDDLWMTAYVIYGLATARDAGFAINKDVWDRGVSSLARQLSEANPKDEYQKSQCIYAAYVLSLADSKQAAEIALNRLSSGLHSPEDLAYAAMTFSNLGAEEQARAYLAQLWRKSTVTPGDIHWGSTHWYYDYAPTERTAIALRAILQITPNDERMPMIVRWLMANRQSNHWYSTRDTAAVLYALSKYLMSTNELQPDYTVTVLHGGRQIGVLKFDRNSVFQLEEELIIPAKDVPKGDNSVRFIVNGRGTLYYTTELTQYVVRKGAAQIATGSGVTVTREYYKLVPKWNGKAGRQNLEPADSPTTEFRSGDTIKVRLVIRATKPHQHVLIEDYFPAGCEPADRGKLEYWEWDYWWVDQDVRDERISFYVDTLPRGKSVMEYEFRATTPGTYYAVPTLVQAMYQPSIVASGPEARVTVR